MQYVQKPYRPSPAPAGATRRDTRSITPPQFRAATQFSTRRADFQQRAIVREAEIQSTSNGIAAVREAIYAGGGVYASSPAGSKESTPRKSINVTFSPNAAAAQKSVSTDRLPIALRSAPGAGKRASPSNQAGPSSDRTSPSKSVAFSMYGSNDGRMPGSSNNGTPGTPQGAARRHPRGQISHQAFQQQPPPQQQHSVPSPSQQFSSRRRDGRFQDSLPPPQFEKDRAAQNFAAANKDGHHRDGGLSDSLTPPKLEEEEASRGVQTEYKNGRPQPQLMRVAATADAKYVGQKEAEEKISRLQQQLEIEQVARLHLQRELDDGRTKYTQLELKWEEARQEYKMSHADTIDKQILIQGEMQRWSDEFETLRKLVLVGNDAQNHLQEELTRVTSTLAAREDELRQVRLTLEERDDLLSQRDAEIASLNMELRKICSQAAGEVESTEPGPDEEAAAMKNATLLDNAKSLMMAGYSISPSKKTAGSNDDQGHEHIAEEIATSSSPAVNLLMINEVGREVQELRAELSKTKEELQQRKNSESLLSKRLETTKEDLKRATSNVMMLNIQMEMGQNAITTGASMGGLGAVTKSNASDKPVMESSSPHTRDSREETVDFLEEIAQQSKSIPTSISRFSASGMPGPTSVSPEKAISPQSVVIRAPSPASARQGSSDQVSNQDGLSDYTITASFVTAPREEFSDYTPIQSLETFETPNRPRTPPGRVESIILGGSQVAPSSETPRVSLESIVIGAKGDKAHADKPQGKTGETAEEHQLPTVLPSTGGEKHKSDRPVSVPELQLDAVKPSSEIDTAADSISRTRKESGGRFSKLREAEAITGSSPSPGKTNLQKIHKVYTTDLKANMEVTSRDREEDVSDMGWSVIPNEMVEAEQMPVVMTAKEVDSDLGGGWRTPPLAELEALEARGELQTRSDIPWRTPPPLEEASVQDSNSHVAATKTTVETRAAPSSALPPAPVPGTNAFRSLAPREKHYSSAAQKAAAAKVPAVATPKKPALIPTLEKTREQQPQDSNGTNASYRIISPGNALSQQRNHTATPPLPQGNMRYRRSPFDEVSPRMQFSPRPEALRQQYAISPRVSPQYHASRGTPTHYGSPHQMPGAGVPARFPSPSIEYSYRGQSPYGYGAVISPRMSPNTHVWYGNA